MNLYEIMCSYEAKKIGRIKQLIYTTILTHLTYVLRKISVVEYSYRIFN